MSIVFYSISMSDRMDILVFNSKIVSLKVLLMFNYLVIRYSATSADPFLQARNNGAHPSKVLLKLNYMCV